MVLPTNEHHGIRSRESPPVGFSYGRAFHYFSLLPRPKAVSTNPITAVINDMISKSVIVHHLLGFCRAEAVRP